MRSPSARATASWSSSAATRSAAKAPGAGMSEGQSAHRRTQRVPLSASRARLPAARRSCGQPGAMHPAGPRATQRRGTEASAGRGATRTRESAAAPADAHGGGAGARQQLAAGQLSEKPSPLSRPMSLVRPTTKRNATSMKPTTEARSMMR